MIRLGSCYRPRRPSRVCVTCRESFFYFLSRVRISVAQVGLLLPPSCLGPPECRDDRCVPPHPASTCQLLEPKWDGAPLGQSRALPGGLAVLLPPVGRNMPVLSSEMPAAPCLPPAPSPSAPSAIPEPRGTVEGRGLGRPPWLGPDSNLLPPLRVRAAEAQGAEWVVAPEEDPGRRQGGQEAGEDLC